ncbi:MAG: glycoside hydrolase family 16 protein [Bacteroidota bacterium]|nr:MAG: glycoside hydrolase family 16 protein [Bacteroidota bacterium]
MKRLPIIFAIISMMFLSLHSFANSGKGSAPNDSDSSSSQNSADYNPGPDYYLAWSDEFEATTIDEKNWNFQELKAGHFNDEWQRYTNSPENAYIENGCLVIKAIHESEVHGMDQYTSARLNTANKQAWKYGKIVVRVKLPYGHGLWPAVWMLGTNIDENGGDTPWPQSGEIDILELYGSKNDSVVECNIHYAGADGLHANMGAVSYKNKEGRFADAFHIFELDWDAQKMVWLVDGNEYASTPITADYLSEFHKEFFILLNVAVGNKTAGRPDSESIFPQHMYIDWVRVYQKKK